MSKEYVKEEIKNIMIAELRMDWDRLSLDVEPKFQREFKSNVEQLIMFNDSNFDKAADEMYKNVDLMDLYEDPKNITPENSNDPEVNLYRNYFYKYLG
jgi:hypothetical protein